MNCPRCQAAKEHLRTEYEGREGGELVWTVFYCRRCSFTWRDSEPAESIDYANGKPGSGPIRITRKSISTTYRQRRR